MNSFFILYILFFTFSAAAVDSLYDLSPSTNVINGESYPRNGRTQFRGTTEAQMDLQKALRAMFGDSSAYVESLFFSAIKARLMNVSFPVAVELGPYLNLAVEAEKEKNGGPFRVDEASLVSQKLVDGTFQYLFRRNQVINQYIDYSSESFVDWPNNIVFTTLISPIAATYGNRMIILNETTNRSLDLNYWNKIHNNTWYKFTRDAAEFITFGYLPPEDVVGYQVRDGAEKNWHFIRTAFYKINRNGKSFVLVFSGTRLNGRRSTCIDRSPSDHLFYHCEYQAGRVVLSPPSISQERPQLLGVIAPCAKNQTSCAQIPLEDLQKYPMSAENLGEEFKKLDISFQNTSLKYFCYSCR